MLRSKTVKRSIFRWFSVFVWFAASGLSGQDRPRFEVSVEAVYLNVVVVDFTGRFHPGLTAEEFEVLEDGTPQELSFFTSESTPVTVMLLLDKSSSIHKSVDGIKDAATEFLRRLRPGDEAAVAFFNQDVHLVTPFTDDRETLYRGVRALRAGGVTALYDAVNASLDELAEIDGRTAILVFSDGADSKPAEGGSDASANDVYERGRLTESSIYTIGFQGATPAGYGISRGFLKRLAEESGGRAFFPKDINELNRAFARIQVELHSQYRLAYVPKNDRLDGTWRKIEVRIKGTNQLHVRTRRGYYAVRSSK
jgi:Ca-activated chloride channel family protein